MRAIKETAGLHADFIIFILLQSRVLEDPSSKEANCSNLTGHVDQTAKLSFFGEPYQIQHSLLNTHFFASAGATGEGMHVARELGGHVTQGRAGIAIGRVA
jgi:hypothetical protein